MSAKENITVKYNDIEIVYTENDNKWHFELRNREREVESLAKAKELIDKPVSEKSMFKPVEGWLINYSQEPVEGTVTSIAAPRYGESRVRFTIKGRKGTTIESMNKFFPDTPENRIVIAEFLQSLKDIEAGAKRRDAAQNKLKKMVATTEQPI